MPVAEADLPPKVDITPKKGGHIALSDTNRMGYQGTDRLVAGHGPQPGGGKNARTREHQGHADHHAQRPGQAD